MALLAAPVLAGPPLRFRLAVGDRLIYERHVRVSGLGDEAAIERHMQQLQLWCLDRAAEGEALVLAEVLPVVEQRAGPSRGTVFFVDERGRRRFADEVLARVDLGDGEPAAAPLDAIFELLPTLPPALHTAPDWLTEPDHFGRCWRCTPAPPARTPAAAADAGATGDGLVRIDWQLEDPTGVAAARGVRQRGASWFDAQAGLIVRVESETVNLTARRRVLTMTRLYARRRETPHWCARRAAEVERFLYTLRLEDRLIDQVVTEPQRIGQILPRFDRIWAELLYELPEAGESPVRRLAESARRAAQDRLADYRERAELAGQWLGAPAAHWSLQTPEGRTLRSEALRDRIVVECFWSAESAACLRSFQMLRQLQQRLPPERFRVVCINIDADAESGRRVARLCGAELVHVLAGPPIGGLPPRELPVFRILDPRSRVLAVDFGWQPRLADKIAQLGR